MIQGTTFKLLACFAEQDTHSFVDLCAQAGYRPDLGGYYLRQLVKGGFVRKMERGIYAITPKGKQQLASSYYQQLTIERPRFVVVLVARQAGAFFILRRTKQPFIGVAEWPAVSVLRGERLAAAAQRAATDRLRVTQPPKLCGYFRRIDMYEDTVFDDKLFAVHTLELPTGAMAAAQAETGQIEPCPQAEMQTLPRPAKSLLDILQFAQNSETGGPAYAEHVYHLNPADLEATN